MAGGVNGFTERSFRELKTALILTWNQMAEPLAIRLGLITELEGMTDDCPLNPNVFKNEVNPVEKFVNVAMDYGVSQQHFVDAFNDAHLGQIPVDLGWI